SKSSTQFRSSKQRQSSDSFSIHSTEGGRAMKESDRHHVPPRKPDANPRFIKRKDSRHHRAYHLLFAAAKSYDDACLILWHDWWKQATDDLVCQYPDGPSLAEANQVPQQ